MSGKVVFEKDPEIFTEEEIKLLNISDEEMDTFQKAQAIVDTVALLPDSEKEQEKLFAKIDKLIPDTSDLKEGLEKLVEIIKDDPKFGEQLMALFVLVNSAKDEPEATTEKVSLDDIKKEQTAATVEQIMNKPIKK